MPVILVAGPPCAGKTTYVQQHAQPGDWILDQDELGQRKMADYLARIRTGVPSLATAWVIRCAPGQAARDQLAHELRAIEVVLLQPTLDELIHRAKARPNPAGTIKAIREWQRIERQPSSLSVDPTTI